MGVVRIPIAHLESGHVYDSWFALRPRNRNAREKAAGSIRLRMLKQSSQGIDSLETAHARLHNVLTSKLSAVEYPHLCDLFQR